MNLGIIAAVPAAVPTPPPFSPLDVPDLITWLDASQLTGLVDGNRIASFTDFSGNGHHALQGYAFSRPYYRTNIQNGLPAAQFVRLEGIIASAYYGAGNALSQPNTILCVGFMNNAEGEFSFFWDGHTSNAAGRNALYANATPAPDRLTMFGGSDGPFTTGYLGAWHLYTCHFNGASSDLTIDAGSPISGSVGAQQCDGLNLGTYLGGGATNLEGYIAEILHFNATLDSTDLANLKSYLLAKWGL